MSDADVLIAEERVTVAGEPLTVREFTFKEGLFLNQQVAPLIEAMAAAAPEDGTMIDLGKLNELFGRFADEFLDLMAVATGKTRQWIEGLTDRDGQALLLVFWRVNQFFFINRLLYVLGGRRQAAQETTIQEEAAALIKDVEASA